MKIKIARNVIHKGRILKKDEVHDIKDREADALIEGEFADEHIEPAPPAPPTPPAK